MIRILMMAAALMISVTTHAQTSVERVMTGDSKAENPADARKEILDQVSSKLAEELTKDLIGEEAFAKNHALIMSKVVKSSSRFLPLSRAGNLVKTADGYQMDYKLTANVAALRQVLHDQGLLNENNAASVLLPVVTFRDDLHSQSDRWWMPAEKSASAVLREMERDFESSLRASFRKNGFYVMQPATDHLSPSVPRALYLETYGAEEVQMISDYFGAPLVVQGSVAIVPADKRKTPAIEVKLTVYQAANHRTIADVARVYPFDTGAADSAIAKKWKDSVDPLANDLAIQVFEAGQKGSIGSSQIRLTVEPRPSLPQIEQLKEKLRSSNLGLRDIHERLISSSSVIFEVESPVTASELAAKLNGFDLIAGKPMTATVDGSGIRARWQGGAQ